MLLPDSTKLVAELGPHGGLPELIQKWSNSRQLKKATLWYDLPKLQIQRDSCLPSFAATVCIANQLDLHKLLTQIASEEHEGTLARTIIGRCDASIETKPMPVLPYKMMRSLTFRDLVLCDTQRTALSWRSSLWRQNRRILEHRASSDAVLCAIPTLRTMSSPVVFVVDCTNLLRGAPFVLQGFPSLLQTTLQISRIIPPFFPMTELSIACLLPYLLRNASMKAPMIPSFRGLGNLLAGNVKPKRSSGIRREGRRVLAQRESIEKRWGREFRRKKKLLDILIHYTKLTSYLYAHGT